MRFDVVWHATAGETTLTSFRHHFDPPPDGPDRFSAVPFDQDAPGISAAAAPGDQLLLRFSVESVHPPGTRQYAPNGDNAVAGGRIPSLRLPR